MTAAGEVVWVGVEPLGERDGRVALYLADHLPRLLPPRVRLKPDTTGQELKSDTTGQELKSNTVRSQLRPPSSGKARRESAIVRKPGPTEADMRDSGSVRLQTDRDEPGLSDRETAILGVLRERGASFFGPLHDAVGGGYPAETVDALWNLVWQGVITNDTFHALRAYTRARAPRRRMKERQSVTSVSSFRSRRLAPPSAEGRWTLVPVPAQGARGFQPGDDRPARRHSLHANATTKWAAAITQQLLARHGVITREAVAGDEVPGGFGIVYPVLKGMEEQGRIRRGYFVAGLGATQFAMPGALDLLRSLRDAPDQPEVAVLAATDPANPYGAALKWPSRKEPPTPVESRATNTAPPGRKGSDPGRGPTRSVGATVILVNGALAAYLPRGDRLLTTFLPDAEPDRSHVGRAVARVLIERARSGGDSPRGMLIEEIDGAPSSDHFMASLLTEAGFAAGAMGLQATFPRVR